MNVITSARAQEVVGLLAKMGEFHRSLHSDGAGYQYDIGIMPTVEGLSKEVPESRHQGP